MFQLYGKSLQLKHPFYMYGEKSPRIRLQLMLMERKIISSNNNPELYPWEPPKTDCQINKNGAITASKPPPVPNRRLVVSVGSNANIDVMKNKFNQRQKGCNRDWYIYECQLYNIEIGVMPFLTSRGYFPATPFYSPGKSCKVYGTYLNKEQAKALTTTEVGYRLVKLKCNRFPLTFSSNGYVPKSFFIYVANSGFITIDGEPLKFPISQRKIWEKISGHIGYPGQEYDLDFLLNNRDLINERMIV